MVDLLLLKGLGHEMNTYFFEGLYFKGTVLTVYALLVFTIFYLVVEKNLVNILGCSFEIAN
jgi:hypothetical protein